MTFNTLLPGPLYRPHERKLLAEIRASRLAHHVGIILGGNRRRGRERGLTDPRHLDKPGAEKRDEVLARSGDLAIPTVTLRVCSTDNLARAVEQVSGILATSEARLGRW